MERTKWNPAHLSKAQINPIDSEFLSRLGLPSLKNDELTYSPELLPDSIEGTDCHLIGICGIWNDLPLYVRESTAGVWMINENDGQPVMINSSCNAFSRFLGLREKYLLDMGQYLPAKVQFAFVMIIRKAMQEIDQAAMTVESFWDLSMQDVADEVTFCDDE